MTAVMEDAVEALPKSAKLAYERGDLADLVYADDTLLIGTSAQYLRLFLLAVEASGKQYGLELHSGKFQLLQVQTTDAIVNANEQHILSSPSLVYLGSSLAADGRVGSELNRRIGIAKADFASLCKVWSHASLTQPRKVEIFKALIESRLLYGLSSACFTKAERRRLDGFQAKCLRQVVGVKTAYLSRVSNASVLERAQSLPASELLVRAQLLQLGKIIRAPRCSPLFSTSFFGEHWQPAVDQFIRRVGRPRKEWVPEVVAEGIRMVGSKEALITAATDVTSWRRRTSTRS